MTSFQVPLRTFTVTDPRMPQGPPSADNPLTSPYVAGLGRKSAIGPWALVSPDHNAHCDYQPREILHITTSMARDPFPPPSSDGHARIWVKTYSENEGVLPQLEAAGVLRSTGHSVHQGYSDFPLCEVTLREEELFHCCPGCTSWETLGGPRFSRCSRCKLEYYCDAECQARHWKDHKSVCRALARGDLIAAENTRRAAMQAYFDQMGVRTLDVG